MPYSIPFRLTLHDRRREADVELARAHADGARGEEVARLVDEDQQREAEDRDDDVHGDQRVRALREAPRLGVGLDELVEVARRRAVDRGERLLDDVRDAEERQPPGEERGDGDLVGGVVGARVGAAALAGLAREREQREASRGRAPRTRASARRRSRAARPASPRAPDR